MGWLQEIGNAVSKVFSPRPTPTTPIDTGDPDRDRVNIPPPAPPAGPGGLGVTPVESIVGIGMSAINLAAYVENRVTQLEAALIQKVGGDKAKNVFLDVRRALVPVDAQTAKQVLDSLEQFVNTLDPAYLNPLVALLATEIQRARDNYWEQASSIPDAVIQAMPPELSNLAIRARYIEVAKANALSLPAFAIEHLGKATAITTIDLIFFERVPGSTTINDLFYWAHELTHVQQYASMTLIGFAEKYFHEEWKRIGDEDVYINELERAADTNACTHFPSGHPHYISRCSGT